MAREPSDPTRQPTPLYWVLVFGLMVFGVVGLFSIGLPFLVLGATLALLAPWRGRSPVFWPTVAGVVGFLVGAILVMPGGCTTTETEIHVTPSMPPEGAGALGEPPTVPISDGVTRCSNALGIDYSGGAGYQPTYLPAIAAGLAGAVLAAVLLWVAVRPKEAVSP